MQSPTQKIKTPIAGVEVEIKDWITGAEAEYIEQAIMAGVDVSPDIANKGGAKIGKFNVESIVEQTHREIEKFVVSVDGKTEDIRSVITELPESDYQFVKNEISERRKKK